MTEKIDIGSDLETLAHTMLKDACKDGVKLAEKVNVFKILADYHVNLKKVNAKNKNGNDADETEFDMTSLQRDVRDTKKGDEGDGETGSSE